MRFITDRVHGGGVLSLDASTGVPGNSVLDIWHEKHPEPGVIDESAFMPCDDLPPLLDLDITADYVEHVAHQIQGSSGPCGSTALQWHGYLLRLSQCPKCSRNNQVLSKGQCCRSFRNSVSYFSSEIDSKNSRSDDCKDPLCIGSVILCTTLACMKL